MIAAARRLVGLNPMQAALALASRRPRVVVWVLALGGIGLLMTFLIAVASMQAFVVMSQQGANNTNDQLSLVLNRPPGEGEVAGSGPGDDTNGQPGDGGTPVDGSGPGSGAQPTGTVGADEVVSVQGIRVHTSIADDVRALLTAAEADGITLSGWGWRDGQTQIRLRRQHCGTTEYAIYRMPSSQCRPPTARPGRSQHERGLAIDFTYNGRSMSTRNNIGFRWLEANAATYGLKNLPSEPWHWSTTGR
jgi:hypothetical protein